MLGGHGKSGRFKHKWTSVLRYGEISDKGFTCPTAPGESKIINVGDLDELAVSFKEQNKKTTVSLNLASLGYDKLLGRGSVGRPFNIKVSKYSKSAAKKIADAGGSIAQEAK